MTPIISSNAVIIKIMAFVGNVLVRTKIVLDKKVIEGSIIEPWVGNIDLDEILETKFIKLVILVVK